MLITDSVVHEFDAIRYLTGEEIRTVQVRVGRTSRHAQAEQQRDPQHVLIETEGDLLADVEMFVNAQFGYQVTTQAVFEKAVVDIGQETGPRVHGAGRWGGEVAPGFVERFRAAYDAEMQSWIDAVRLGEIGGPTAWTDMRQPAAAKRVSLRCEPAKGSRSRCGADPTSTASWRYR